MPLFHSSVAHISIFCYSQALWLILRRASAANVGLRTGTPSCHARLRRRRKCGCLRMAQRPCPMRALNVGSVPRIPIDRVARGGSRRMSTTLRRAIMPTACHSGARTAPRVKRKGVYCQSQNAFPLALTNRRCERKDWKCCVIPLSKIRI
ncbi:hypothetical protein K438DRAFT_1801249, partial [Mycena galopus ATCC 62051]